MAVDVFPTNATGTTVVGSFGASQSVNSEGVRATYSYASITNTPAATPTDILTLTATTLPLRVSRIEVGGLATTAGSMPVAIILRSAATTGGTSTAPAAVRHNPSDQAATATLGLFTANGTVGTAFGTLRNSRVFLNVATAQADRCVMDFGERNEKAIVVPVGYTLAIGGNGATVPSGGVLDLSITWEEGV